MTHNDPTTGPMEVGPTDFAALDAQIAANLAMADHRTQRRMRAGAGLSDILLEHAMSTRGVLLDAGLTPDPAETATQIVELTPQQRFAIHAGRTILAAEQAEQELGRQHVNILRTVGRIAAFFVPVPHVGGYSSIRDVVVRRAA